VTTINGGAKANIIPERCDLAIDRRMMPGETGDSVMAELEQIVDSLRQDEKKLQIEMNMRPQSWNPYLISETEPVVQATRAAIEEIVGVKPQILGKAGCTDASHIFHMGAIPVVIFGPGNEKLAHQPDECVEIKKYVAAVPIFLSIFQKLLG